MDINLKQFIVYSCLFILIVCQIAIQGYLYRAYQELKKINQKTDVIIDGLKAIFEHIKK